MKNTFNFEISKQEYLDSLTEGVRQAILTITESGDGYSGPTLREPFLYAIQKGVQEAVFDAMPDMSYLKSDLVETFEKTIKDRIKK